MSKKSQVHKAPIAERIAKARREGRTQQALELTRTLAKYEPTDAHCELLRQVTLERGQALQAEGKLRDAAALFNNALTLGGGADYLARVLQRLAACGAIAEATTALNKLPDPSLRQQVLNHIIDAAIAKGPSGKMALPEAMHAPFDSILGAFAHYEAGRDEETRAALQTIGLQSPLLEWKVLLRGLLAYHANDDARALENWQRLDPARLPARLCAALRASIDPKFLGAQPPATQQGLRAELLRQQGGPRGLHELRDLLNKDNLAPAFRKAEAILPGLRSDYPELAARLGHVFVWAIIDHGQPEDVDRHLRIFGSPADDPNLDRVQGLALEARGLWPEAHQAWQSFINQVAKRPQHWPGEAGKHVQAMIWARMAENALPTRRRKGHSGNPLFDLFTAETGPLKPSAETCYGNAIKFAPDRLDTYRALFELYRQDDKLGKAKKIGAELLKRFPEHTETLEALAELAMDEQDYKKAQQYLEQAIHANPLDRALPGLLAIARQRWGLQLTLATKYDQARRQYEQALKIWNGSKTSLLCQWAACELKANNGVRAEDLVAQALSEPNQRLACRYALVGESVRAKLSAAERKRIAAELKAALAEAPTPAEIIVLIDGAAHQRLVHDDPFHGQKTQEKTILKFLDTIHFDAFSEAQLVKLVKDLATLQARKPWFACLNFARRRYLKNAHFRVSFADYHLMEGAADPKTHLAREHLDSARRIVEEMPRGEEQQQLLEAIKQREEVLTALQDRNRSMMNVLDRVFGDADGFEGDEDDEF